jgi:hypothetical protein
MHVLAQRICRVPGLLHWQNLDLLPVTVVVADQVEHVAPAVEVQLGRSPDQLVYQRSLCK